MLTTPGKKPSKLPKIFIKKIHTIGNPVVRKKSSLYRNQKSIQKIKFLLGAGFGIVALYYLSFNQYGILQHFKTKQKLEQLRQRTEQLEKEQQTIIESIERLKNDFEYIEKIAREKYFLIKKGEEVYWIRKNSPSEKPSL